MPRGFLKWPSRRPGYVAQWLPHGHCRRLQRIQGWQLNKMQQALAVGTTARPGQGLSFRARSRRARCLRVRAQQEQDPDEAGNPWRAALISALVAAPPLMVIPGPLFEVPLPVHCGCRRPPWPLFSLHTRRKRPAARELPAIWSVAPRSPLLPPPPADAAGLPPPLARPADPASPSHAVQGGTAEAVVDVMPDMVAQGSASMRQAAELERIIQARGAQLPYLYSSPQVTPVVCTAVTHACVHSSHARLCAQQACTLALVHWPPPACRLALTRAPSRR